LIGGPRAVGPLIQALRDPDAMVRWGSAEALGNVGDPLALPELERVARYDVELWVAYVARKAAEEIRGRMNK